MAWFMVVYLLRIEFIIIIGPVDVNVRFPILTQTSIEFLL